MKDVGLNFVVGGREVGENFSWNKDYTRAYRYRARLPAMSQRKSQWGTGKHTQSAQQVQRVSTVSDSSLAISFPST